MHIVKVIHSAFETQDTYHQKGKIRVTRELTKKDFFKKKLEDIGTWDH